MQRLRRWQVDALQYNDRPRLYIEASPRLGKTRYTALWAKDINAQRMLVIAPKVVTTDWAKEIGLTYPDLDVHLVVDKQASVAHNIVSRLVGKHRFCVIIGHDSVKDLRKVGRRNQPVDMLALLETLNLDTLVVDEAHYVKSPTSRRGKCIRWLAKDIPYVRLLSGSPLPNGPEDAWGQYSILDPDAWGSSYFNHARTHFIVNSWEYNRVIGLKHPEKFQRMIDSVTLRYNREDEFGPDQWITEVREIPFDTKTKKMYKDAFDDWVLEQDTHGIDLELPHTLTRMLRLRQLCSGYLPEINEYNEVTGGRLVHTLKMDAVIGDLEPIITAGEKVVLFHQFTFEGDEYERRIYGSGIPCWRISGADAADVRSQRINSFNNCDTGAVIVVQTQAGGIGISFATATHAFFTSQSYSYDVEMQARDRIYSPGKTRSVVYYRMAHSIEGFIAWVLESKQEFTNAVRTATLHELVFGAEYEQPKFK